MFNKKGKAILVSITGAFLLSLLPNFESNVDNQVEANYSDNVIEKVSYSTDNTRDASENYTMLDDNEGLGIENNTANDGIEKEVIIEKAANESEVDNDFTETEKNDNPVQEVEKNVSAPNKSTETLNRVNTPSNGNKPEKIDSINEKVEVENTEVMNKVNETEEIEDTPANNTPLRPQLMRANEPVGVFIHGEKYSYYGDRNNLQFRKSSGEVMEVYVGKEYHLDENYIDVMGQSRKSIADSYNGMAIVNKTESGGYSIYTLYQK